MDRKVVPLPLWVEHFPWHHTATSSLWVVAEVAIWDGRQWKWNVSCSRVGESPTIIARDDAEDLGAAKAAAEGVMEEVHAYLLWGCPTCHAELSLERIVELRKHVGRKTGAMPNKELITPRRERQLSEIQQRIEEWYWHAVEKRPQYDEGESHTVEVRIGMIERDEYEELFDVTVERRETTSL